MRTHWRLWLFVFSLRNSLLLIALGFSVSVLLLAVPIQVCAQDYIPATDAFNNSPVCSASDLRRDMDKARANPEWKAVKGLNIDPFKHILHDAPTILEGFVAFPLRMNL
jgi:hypothetical protein